ncbi:hypothetical protein GQ42DRAFT_163345 [Ramicandelaber brevisporus]|nr:hypothetical protein GQ42DRAFT_163345 [Ramicandelaber brevisporus]
MSIDADSGLTNGAAAAAAAAAASTTAASSTPVDAGELRKRTGTAEQQQQQQQQQQKLPLFHSNDTDDINGDTIEEIPETAVDEKKTPVPHEVSSLSREQQQSPQRTSRRSPKTLGAALAALFHRLMNDPMPTLNHWVRFISTSRGLDKILMLVQYVSKLVIWGIQRRAVSNGTEAAIKAANQVAEQLRNIAGPASNFRILMRFTGLIPLFAWIRAVESNTRPESLLLHGIQRLENLCNLIYYPLEHMYWLGANGVIRMSPKTIEKISVWSCRFWAAYVVLHFFSLAEELRVLRWRKKDITTIEAFKNPDAGEIQAKLEKIEQAKVDWTIDAMINTAYFPLTLHWSMYDSTILTDASVGFFGTIAGIGQFMAAWRATA